MNYTLEVIAFDIYSCLLAEKNGANRIELCDNQAEGGTTPSYGLISSARSKVSIELFPIIRPRGGDFLYSDDEFNIMKEDVLMCKKIGCDGIVVGILTQDGSVDKIRMSILTHLAYPMSVTFHRAFDRTNDALKAMRDIIDCGCDRILTSGQQPTALEGLSLIKELIIHANNQIIIMPGSGIRSENIEEIALKSGATEFHSSARIFIDSKMTFKSSSMKESMKNIQLDENEVRLMKDKLNNL